MTAWTPTYKVLVNNVEITDVTIANLTITSGRTDIYEQPIAGYCQLQLINFDNSSYNFTVGTSITVEVTNSSATYVPIFGGRISDFTISVNQAGSLGYTTACTITALGALSKLPKIIDNAVLAADQDGDQIYTLLSGYLLGSWNDVPASIVSQIKEHGHKITISGVPAPNINFAVVSGQDSNLLIKLIRVFNESLRIYAKQYGYNFLDVYALTNRGDGISNKEWHIDNFHLKPTAIPVLFNDYYFQAAKPS
jgi:hypothetical protein